MSYNIEKELSLIIKNQIEMANSRERRNYNPEKEVRVKKKKTLRREKKFNNSLLRVAIFDSALAEEL